MAFLLRASQAHRWVKCTAWQRMVQSMPDISDPTVRDEGTAFHWCSLMIWLGHAINIGQRVQIDGMSSPVVVTDEMLDHVDEYLDRIRSRGSRPMLEYEVAAPRIHPECGGTTDSWNFVPEKMTLYVDDAKYGYRWVDPYQNWQLLVYVCGLLDHIGVIDDRHIKVEMSVFQPRAYRRDGPWFVWHANAADLRTYFNILSNAAHTVLSPFAKCITGEWCTNCDARANCDAYDQAVENALDVSFEPINNELSPIRADTELLRIERAMQILEARQSALMARAEMFMRDGQQLRHYEMKPGRSRPIWKPGIEASLKQMGVPFKERPITPTQVRDRKLLDPKVIDALSDRPPAGLKVARVDEERAARMFGQIIES